MFFFSELGDKTFFLTMIYAATNSFLKTLLVSGSTMLVMNFLALLLGFYIPIFLYRNIIDWVAIIVFGFFGLKMIYDAYHMDNKLINSEYEEVKQLVRRNSSKRMIYLKNEDIKSPLIPKENEEANFESIFTFISTLVIAELGDKSQIAAIILGAKDNFYGVLIGTSLGFLLCTITAILFGNFLSKTLTNKQITYMGGVMFLLFSLAYLFEKIF